MIAQGFAERVKTKSLIFALVLAVGLAAAAGSVCAGPTLGEVTWKGVQAFSTSDLAADAELTPGRLWSPGDCETAHDKLLEIYRTEGYMEASARLEEAERVDEVHLSVYMSEGRRYKIGEIRVQGGELLSRGQLFESCPSLRPGSPFSKSALECAFDKLLRIYGREGFAQCRVSPGGFAANPEGFIDFTLDVIEGPRYRVESLSVRGGRTRGRTAEMISGLKQGDPLDPWALDEARRRLIESGLFSRVGELAIVPGSSDSLAVIEVEVDEVPLSSVSGLFGYSGRQGGAVGFIDLRLGNILGTARQGALRWEGSGAGLSSYEAYYKEPWLGGLPLALELGIEHVAQDTTYSTTEISGGLRLSVGRRISLSLGASKERTAVAGPTEGTGVRRARVAVRAGADFDVRDNPLDPRRGFMLSAAGDWGSRTDTGDAAAESKSWRVSRMYLGGEVHRRLYGRHGLFVGAQWRKVMTNEAALPWDQLLRFGGATSLRGYREDQFRARETGLIQLEHRIALGDRGSRLFLFSDVGLLRGASVPNGPLIGYGLGIRAASAAGLVGLDYGLAKGDSWSEGKVHVRLTRMF